MTSSSNCFIQLFFFNSLNQVNWRRCRLCILKNTSPLGKKEVYMYVNTYLFTVFIYFALFLFSWVPILPLRFDLPQLPHYSSKCSSDHTTKQLDISNNRYCIYLYLFIHMYVYRFTYMYVSNCFIVFIKLLLQLCTYVCTWGFCSTNVFPILWKK